jgi:hypothetical protein
LRAPVTADDEARFSFNSILHLSRYLDCIDLKIGIFQSTSCARIVATFDEIGLMDDGFFILWSLSGLQLMLQASGRMVARLIRSRSARIVSALPK